MPSTFARSAIPSCFDLDPQELADGLGGQAPGSASRFHHVAKAYTCDQSLFPTVARPPVLTGLTLARHVARWLI